MIPACSEEWATAEKVLAVRLDTIGDVLMTTPAIRALKESRPGRRVTLLTSRPGAAIAAYVPELDDVVEYAAPWIKAGTADPGADRAMVERLAAAGFDAAVVFTAFSQPSLPAAYLCALAGVPLRLAHSRDKPYHLLTDWVRELEPEHGVRHEVRRQLDLVARVGATTADERLSLRVDERDRERVRSLLTEAGIGPDERWLVVHPGASAPSRRWPADRFAEAARRLAAGDGYRVVVTGDEGERELAASVAAAARGGLALAGSLSLGELAALLEAAPLLLSNNTGPVHMAAALGTPVVDVYALTNPQHRPWMVESRVLFHDVPCRWCHSSVCLTGHHGCVRGVTVDEVVGAVRELANAA